MKSKEFDMVFEILAYKQNPIYKDMVLIEIEPCQAEIMRVIRMAEEYVKKHLVSSWE